MCAVVLLLLKVILLALVACVCCPVLVVDVLLLIWTAVEDAEAVESLARASHPLRLVLPLLFPLPPSPTLTQSNNDQ